MQAVDQFELPGSTAVIFGHNQPEYVPLPALIYPDGRVLIEWTFTPAERAAIARGENLKHWILRNPKCHHCGAPRLFEPLQLEVTAAHV